MTEDVYFNEPGFEGQSGTEEGEKKNEAYSNIIRYCNIKIAMIKQIKNPPAGFEEIIHRHFYLKKETILAECQEWLLRSNQKNAVYTGLVSDHNPTWCGLFKQPGKYQAMLAEAIEELKQVLEAIPPPSRIEAISSNQMMANKRRLVGGHSKSSSSLQQTQPQPALLPAKESKTLASETLNEGQQQQPQSHSKPISQQTVKEETAEQEEEEEEKRESGINSNISPMNDTKQTIKQMDILSEEVKNRWSRYICALGIESVRKQSACSVFLSGCTNLGLEIAKNLTLAGLARLTILSDNADTTKLKRINSLFGENTDPIQELQQLNPYVKVDCLNQPLVPPLTTEYFQNTLKLRDYQIVILTDTISHETACAIGEFCHANAIFFINTNVIGPFARVFIDFNEKFAVNDPNGEPFKDSYISSIEITETVNAKNQTVITTLQPHGLQDGDTVTFTQVKGMERLKNDSNFNNNEPGASSSSINETLHKVIQVQSPCIFVLASLGNGRFSPYEGSGIVKGVKIPQTISFSSLIQAQDMSTKFFDANLLYHDFDKSSHSIYLHIAFYGLSLFQQKNQRFPGAWDKTDMKEFSELCLGLYEKFEFAANNQMEKPNQKEFLHFIALFSFTCSGQFHPLCAFIGGVVAQEAIKAMTNKFMPIQQFFYTDCIEVVPWNSQLISTQDATQTAQNSVELRLAAYADIAQSELQRCSPYNTKEKNNNNTDSTTTAILIDPSFLLQIVIGKDLLDKLKHLNLFMIGSGAIGCELLKNFAMLSLCTGESNNNKLKRGQLTLTDPDHIETSNLNRQFLFRQEHISKPKSITAAAAAIKINSHLKNHIVARLDKVCEASKDIFNDGFFEAQDIVANALDNVQARKYVDKRCLTAKVPLLESGTLGPKGHVQVIVPYQSESYGSQEDPSEEGGDIPHCTLKMFPEETVHCVEWARDKFTKQATLKPKSLRLAMEAANLKDKDESDYECPLSISELRKALKQLERRPRDFQDCVAFAVRKFYKYFRNAIRQLMHTYPLKTRLKDGTEFWKLPKRSPNEISMLDPENQLHRDFIASAAILCAKVFSIKHPADFRKEERKKEIIRMAEKVQIEDFHPSEEKTQEIHSEVQSEEQQKNNGEIKRQDKEKGEQKINENNNNTAATDTDNEADSDYDQIQSNTKNLLEKLKSLMISNNLSIDSISPEEFEKDNDQNGHIDYISSLANCRAVNYSLTPMDWLDVKLKAGKIVPALATTTAAIAALQTIELIKQVMGLSLSQRKNAFLNLAVPAFQLTEPAPSPIFKITPNISVSIWENWEVAFEDSQNHTIQQLFEYFAINKKLKIVTILLDSELVFAQTMSEAEKKSIQASSLSEAFFLPEEGQSYVDLDVLFTELDSTQILLNTPVVRIVFKKQQSVLSEDKDTKNHMP